MLDQSRGAASTELLAKIDSTDVFRRELTLSSPTQIADAIENKNLLLVLSIPSDFEARLAKGEAAPMQLILDGRNSTTAGAAAAQIGAIVNTYNQTRNGIASISIERRAWYNPNLESRWNLMTALIAALSMIQTLMLDANVNKEPSINYW